MSARLAILAFLLTGCRHSDGCDGNRGSDYAKNLNPEADCWSIHYGDDRQPIDFALCKAPGPCPSQTEAKCYTAEWLCQKGESTPGTCYLVGPIVRVLTTIEPLPAEKTP